MAEERRTNDADQLTQEPATQQEIPAADVPVVPAVQAVRDQLKAETKALQDEEAALRAQLEQGQPADIKAFSDVAGERVAPVAAKETEKGDEKPKQQEQEAQKPKADDELAAERQRLAQERQALEAERAALSERTVAETPETWDKWAKEYDDEGRNDLAQTARQKAEELRREDVARKQVNYLREAVKKYPDLQNPDSRLAQGVEGLLRTRPQLLQYAEGVGDAVEYVAARIAAEEVTALRNQLREVQAQKAEIERLLHPTPGDKTAETAGGEVNFSKLSLEQQEALLRRAVLAAARNG